MTQYCDFDLSISKSSRGYRVGVISPAGETSADFDLPFSGEDIESLRMMLHSAPHNPFERQRWEEESRERIRNFGTRLFEEVFTNDVRSSFSSSMGIAEEQGAGLRIRLRLTEAPDLMDLPWEYLYSRSKQRFFSLYKETPIVRYIPMLERNKPLFVSPPLNILVMISSPKGYNKLDTDHEWQIIRESLNPLIETNQATLTRVPNGRSEALHNEFLREMHYHIFHFIGHGIYDPHAQRGALIMEDHSGYGQAITSDHLQVLIEHRNLRLAILNTCEGARTSCINPLAGVAQSLVVQGIPAVIAMQAEITDTSAISFSKKFYELVAEGHPVDLALTIARKAMHANGSIEWGTPVLYMRSHDGRLFWIHHPAEEAQRRLRIATLARETEAAMSSQDYRKALEKLQLIVGLEEQRGTSKNSRAS